MISPDSMSKRFGFRWLCPSARSSGSPFYAGCLAPLAQVADDPAVLTPGLHHLKLLRADEPELRYAIYIPANYAPSAPVPLILALHFGVRDSTGAGGDVVEILIGPALLELGAIIVAPDSVRGDWSTPENEKAVNALLDMVLAHYAIDKKKVAVTGYSMGGAGSWHFAEKFPERFSAVSQSPAGRRRRPPDGGFRFWRFIRVTTRSCLWPDSGTHRGTQQAGVNAKLIPSTGITHYETSRFAPALRRAVPWLREVWR